MDVIMGRLMVLKSGDDQWRFIDALPSLYGDEFPEGYTYIILWGGRFYAVDYIARILSVNTDDFSMRVLLNMMMFTGLEYCFVGSDEELLLLGWYSDGRIRLFRLGAETEKWTEIAADLGDKILCWCGNCSFLASAADIFGYDAKFRGAYLLESGRIHDTFTIYAFESHRIVSIDSSLPIAFEKIFWHPPNWVIETL